MMQSSHSNSSQPTAPDTKILSDLSALNEQITLCQSMLVNAGNLSSINANEALLTVIGFLEACVPRMVELIEAAAQGALKEGTFDECFRVNDRLTNILADVEKDPTDRTPLTPAAASSSSEAASSGGDSTSLSDINIDQGMNKLSVDDSAVGAATAISGGKTTGLDSEDDPFAGGLDLLAPTPATAAEKSFTISDSIGTTESGPDDDINSKPNADEDDDFDAFFKGRTSAS